ncbi:hypothetical protein M422DRAFT_38250 [Sphaerobolus stellatus SS14]|uniref:Chitin synthase export chaperone n=1 Tax=Sphaerobolus stellatus (strain SS14) TaxID=990650 RepID=A0A0C9ULX6_SPHS4|nr:hypothetical protein M422DRAFT_38250 [Sphaerobolus stellatus SS14]
MAISPHTCTLLYQISGWFIFWGGCLAEIILVFRTWAIWGEDKRIGYGLCIFFIAVVTPLIYLTHLGLPAISIAPVSFLPSQRLTSCLVTEDRGVTILADYVIVTFFETVILVLTLIKGLGHYRASSSSLVTTMYKDGFLYYVYLLILSLANVLFIASLQKRTGGSLIFMQRVFHAILTGRILLHIRTAAIADYQLPSHTDEDSTELSFMTGAAYSSHF